MMKPNSITCRSCRRRLSAFMDGEVSSDEAAQIAEHIQACHACEADCERLMAISQALAVLPAPPEPSGKTFATMVARMREKKGVPEWSFFRVPSMWGGLACACGLVIGISLGSGLPRGFSEDGVASGSVSQETLMAFQVSAFDSVPSWITAGETIAAMQEQTWIR